MFFFFLGKGVGGSIFTIFVDTCDYRSMIQLKYYLIITKLKKKILLLRYNLSNYGLFFKGQGFKQHVIQSAQKKNWQEK